MMERSALPRCKIAIIVIISIILYLSIRSVILLECVPKSSSPTMSSLLYFALASISSSTLATSFTISKAKVQKFKRKLTILGE